MIHHLIFVFNFRATVEAETIEEAKLKMAGFIQKTDFNEQSLEYLAAQVEEIKPIKFSTQDNKDEFQDYHSNDAERFGYQN